MNLTSHSLIISSKASKRKGSGEAESGDVTKAANSVNIVYKVLSFREQAAGTLAACDQCSNVIMPSAVRSAPPDYQIVEYLLSTSPEYLT